MKEIMRWIALLLLPFLLACSSEQKQQEMWYNESHRPQFHFTYKNGWLSDMNGLVYYGGEYHLFSQHCPGGPKLSYPNTYWGHAVSTDLVHWEELPPALAPDSLGPIFSGSAIVDWNNTLGFQKGEDKTLVAFYTAAGYILDDKKDGLICMAYSTDKGRTWTKYANNPVLPAITHYNRDPKVFWYEPTKQWIMAITLSGGSLYDGDYWYAILSSDDLKSWKEVSRFEMPRGVDCPDMFELPVDGKPENKRWVFWGGDGTHAIGTFDGKTFSVEGSIQLPLVDYSEDGANGYAAQTFNDMPKSDGRVIQMSWYARGNYPGMPFNQQATVPCELSLRTTDEGIRLCRYPVREVDQLHGDLLVSREAGEVSSDNILKNVSGELFDLQLELDLHTAHAVMLDVRGSKIIYDPIRKILSCKGKSISPLSPDGTLRIRLLIDRTTLEIFADNGRTSLTFALPPGSTETPLSLSAKGGMARIKTLKVWAMKSIWFR